MKLGLGGLQEAWAVAAAVATLGACKVCVIVPTVSVTVWMDGRRNELRFGPPFIAKSTFLVVVLATKVVVTVSVVVKYCVVTGVETTVAVTVGV